MQIKYSSPIDWSFPDVYTRRVKIGSAGLVGQDRIEFAKIASAELLWKLDRMDHHRDEHDVHLVAVGADEAYGGNRNGDTFDEDTCIKQAHTFVDMALPFRDHRHLPEEGHPWFGRVKAAAYNPTMRRIELLLGLNAAKTACDRNGGQVADREIQTSESGKLIPWSMGALVAEPYCSWCKKIAAKPENRCTEDECEAGGTLKHLGQYRKVAGVHHHLREFNPGARFFDISSVGLNADMVAFGSRADYVAKTASAVVGFDAACKLAQANAANNPLPPLRPLLVSPTEPGKPLGDREQGLLKVAYELAKYELHAKLPEAAHLGFAERNVEAARKLAAGDYGRAQARALAREGVIFSLDEYAAWTDRSEHVKEAQAVAPSLFAWYVQQTDGARKLVDPSRTLQTCGLDLSSCKMASAFAGSSYEPNAVVNRARSRILAVASPAPSFVKTSSEGGPALSQAARDLALDYATYKLAAVETYVTESVVPVQPEFLAACIVGQNRA